MKSIKVIKIGLDFDGVVAYNPFRVIRAPIAFIKHRILRKKKVSFFVPHNWWQTIIWALIHESSVFPAKGFELLKEMAGNKRIKFFLITGRYGFLKQNTYRWLEKYNLKYIFSKICVNDNRLQPHEFKKGIIADLGLDYYIEDNWDIVQTLSTQKGNTKIFWIFNILDAGKNYVYKFPYLEKGLEKIVKDEGIV